MDKEISKFFARSLHLNEHTLGKIREDILEVVTMLKLSLRVSPWGDTSQSKLCIYGGLPYSKKGEREVTFLIPVQIWFTNQFPLEPPTIYVVPVDDVQIVTNHRFVDVTGLVYTPALSSWNPAKSSLKDTVLQLIKLFCLFSPLYVDDTAPPPLPPPPPRNASASPAGSPARVFDQQGDTAADRDSPLEERQPTEEEVMCVICLSCEKDTVLVPCGHYCCCQGCASNISQCPMCRKGIQFRQKVFL